MYWWSPGRCSFATWCNGHSLSQLLLRVGIYRLTGMDGRKAWGGNTSSKLTYLVGGFNSSWNICSSNWIIFPGRDEHKKYLKPPPGHILILPKKSSSPIGYLKYSTFFGWLRLRNLRNENPGRRAYGNLPKNEASKKNSLENTRWAPTS